MKKIFVHTCLDEKVYKKYYTENIGGDTYIMPDTGFDFYNICPFDNAGEMVLEYLTIGYMNEMGLSTDEAVLEFVSKYGMLKRGSKRLKASEFSEDAGVLYQHFCEIASADFPDTPEWILETEPVSAVIVRDGKGAIAQWQTKNLASAIELAYTLLICSSERYIGLCKHCKAPYSVKNPKSEFCSPSCRNKFNVYKSRAKA